MSNVEKNSVTGGFFPSYLPPSEKELLIATTSSCSRLTMRKTVPRVTFSFFYFVLIVHLEIRIEDLLHIWRYIFPLWAIFLICIQGIVLSGFLAED